MSDAIVEGLKELARNILFAIIPVAITYLQNGDIEPKVVGIAIAIASLGAVDKWLHERNKDNKNTMTVKGLSPI